jgi:hypothetical protein
LIPIGGSRYFSYMVVINISSSSMQKKKVAKP